MRASERTKRKEERREERRHLGGGKDSKMKTYWGKRVEP